MIRRRPSLRETLPFHDAKRRARRIVEHDGVRRRRHDDDVVKRAGAILDEREHGTSARQFSVDQVLPAIDSEGIPASVPQILHQPRGANAAGAPVEQMGERLGIEAARAPIAQDHRRGGSPAECFGL